jgi:hypothetical protein
MTTALEYAATFGRRKPNPEEVQKLYELRENDVAALVKKGVITVEGIQTLDWGGRFAIANEHFDKCDEAAQHALLHDQHHGVRAAASLFKPAAKPVALAPANQAAVAEVARAIMNGKDRIATLHGLKSVAGIEEMIVSTHPVETLKRAEAFIAGFEGNEQQDGAEELLIDLRAAIEPHR